MCDIDSSCTMFFPHYAPHWWTRASYNVAYWSDIDIIHILILDIHRCSRSIFESTHFRNPNAAYMRRLTGFPLPTIATISLVVSTCYVISAVRLSADSIVLSHISRHFEGLVCWTRSDMLSTTAEKSYVPSRRSSKPRRDCSMLMRWLHGYLLQSNGCSKVSDLKCSQQR